MKSSRESRIDQLENALKQAYVAKNDAQVGDQWQENVMRRIRQIQPDQPRESLIWGSGRLAWQIMPATSVLALLVGGVFFFSDTITSVDMITTLYNNTQKTAIDTIFYM